MGRTETPQSESNLRVEYQRTGETAGAIPAKLVLPIHSPLDSGKPPLFVKIANRLVELGVDVIPVTFGWYSKRFLKENFIRPERASYDIVDFMRSTPMPTEEETQLLEKKYGSPNFMQIFYASFMRSYPEFCRLLVAHVKFLEYLIETENPIVLFEEGVGGLELVWGAICRRYGVKLLNMQSARCMTNRAVIKRNVCDDWEKTARIFRELQGRSLTLEERRQAVDFLSSFLTSRDYPSYMKLRNGLTSPRFLLRASLHRVSTFIRWATEKARSGYSFENPIVESANWLAWLIRYLVYTKLGSFWDSPSHEDKYVLLPLQFEPEVSLGIYAPFFSDQLFVAEIVSKSLPVGYKLYVREHPSMARRFRPTSFYRQTKRIPQVRLISPAIPIRDLIRNAAAVVVITSTTGLEAIFYGKPTIVLGNPFYKSSGLCYTVQDLNTLPVVVRGALEEKAVDRETLLKYIVAILQGTYEGEIGDFSMESSGSENNIGKLCQAILAEMNTGS